jgi:hypothetical protein
MSRIGAGKKAWETRRRNAAAAETGVTSGEERLDELEARIKVLEAAFKEIASAKADGPVSSRSKAALKAWQTRRAKQQMKYDRSEAARKAWVTRRSKAA